MISAAVDKCTTEEAKIIENLKKIENFCKKKLCRSYDSVSVDFGETKGYSWNAKPKHSLIVESDNIYYRSGSLVLPFEDTSGSYHSDIYRSSMFARDLVLNWQEVKRGLLEDLKQQQAEQSAIMDFHI